MKLKQYYFWRTDFLGQKWKYVFTSLRAAAKEHKALKTCETTLAVSVVRWEPRKITTPVILGSNTKEVFYMRKSR